MSTKSPKRKRAKNARYLQRVKQRALATLAEQQGGLECYVFSCENTDLQCAHREPTGLKGPSRGMKARYKDVLRNPSKYCLLCRDHHVLFDSGQLTL